MLPSRLNFFAARNFACINMIYVRRRTTSLTVFAIVSAVLGLTVLVLIRSGHHPH